VEIVLGAVSDDTRAMKSIAAVILSSSGQTAQRAEQALRESQDASTNVDVVAESAEELSHSISEIDRQLSQTTEHVNDAVAETEKTNDKYAALAQATRTIGDVINVIK